MGGVDWDLNSAVDFLSDLVVIKLFSKGSIKKVLDLESSETRHVASLCPSLFLGRLRPFLVNGLKMPWKEIISIYWQSMTWLAYFSKVG